MVTDFLQMFAETSTLDDQPAVRESGCSHHMLGSMFFRKIFKEYDSPLFG